jgi:tyrosyl-tRNA synthetase
MSDDEWIYEIVPHEQIESMQDKAEQIKRNMDEGVSIVLTADNQSAIEMCQCWRKSMKGDMEAAFKIASFMSSIISTIENHLMEEGINPYED